MKLAFTHADSRQNLVHPGRPLATRSALAARFVSEKPGTVEQYIDHTCLIVDNSDCRSPQSQTSRFAWTIEIEWKIEFIGGQKSHADSARDDGFCLATLPDSATVLVDQLASGHSHRQFNTTRLIDMSTDAVQFWSVTSGITGIFRVRRHSHAFEPVATPIKDLFDTRHCFDVVDDRRLAEKSFDGRERRLDAWPRAFSFQTLDQPGLFAANVRGSSAMEHNIQVKPLAVNILAKQSCGITFFDCFFQNAITASVLITQVDVRLA